MSDDTFKRITSPAAVGCALTLCDLSLILNWRPGRPQRGCSIKPHTRPNGRSPSCTPRQPNNSAPIKHRFG
ncbi:hypothetical protein [Alloactinosynnema sp. L-07]|nr:hypothetical protein [Alloactinosynnema sp. L-07]